MIIKNIADIIESIAPLYLCEEYDNSGFIYGDPSIKCSGVMVALDLTPEVAKEAILLGCNLVVEHHPSIFSPIKFIDNNLSTHIALEMCISNKITVYAAHTNIDNAPDGLNKYFMKKLGIVKPELSLEKIAPFVGDLPENTNLSEYVDKIKVDFSDNTIFYVGDPNKTIRRVACVNGAGGCEENLIKAMKLGADVFISAEFKYHVLRLAKDSGYAIISVGHFNSEEMFSDLICDILKQNNVFAVNASKRCLNPVA